MSISAKDCGLPWAARKGFGVGHSPVICAFMAVLVLVAGCSRGEEPPPPVQDNKVVRPIERPPPPPPQMAEAPATDEDLGAPPAEQTAETGMAAVTEKAPGEPEKEVPKAERPPEPEPGYYVVSKGETLWSVAGRAEVYGDPLKWPILWRSNADTLGDMAEGVDFVDKELPEGIRLKVVTPEEVEENLKRRANHFWVLNILSSPNKGEVTSAAMKLLRGGYPVYITRAKVKGKDYMRVRVGFFKSKKEADSKGEEIVAQLKMGELWKTKAGEEEFKGFGGY